MELVKAPLLLLITYGVSPSHKKVIRKHLLLVVCNGLAAKKGPKSRVRLSLMQAECSLRALIEAN